MSHIAQPPLQGYRSIGASLAESRRLEAEQETNRLNAEIGLPAINAGGSGSGLMPRSGTDGQRSRWSSYSYDRPGSEMPAERREPVDS